MAGQFLLGAGGVAPGADAGAFGVSLRHLILFYASPQCHAVELSVVLLSMSQQ